MDTIVVFILFFVALLVSLYNGVSILYPLLFGLVCFTLVAMRKGFTLPGLLAMMLNGSKKSLIVIRIFVLIGAITAVWRACGTISFIVYYGILFMNADYFIVSAFLLSCLVSFLLGTSFGTVGTIGVVLIVLAQSGNVDINMAAGAIIAGAYFGDRCSAMSSSANLVVALTHTKLYTNIANMTKTAVIPFALSIIGYLYLSQANPLAFYENSIGNEIANSFNIDLVVLFPAVIILLLAAFKVDVKLSMSISIVSGILIAIFVQGASWSQMLNYILTGYTTDKSGVFSEIIQGGGLYSMLKVSLIVLISSAYAGIFEGTGLLQDVEQFFERLGQKINTYPTMILSSIATAAFSCNQTLAVMLTHQITHKLYERKRLSNYRLALDLENTVIVISPLIPWNIAGAVPAAALSADSGFIIYAFYLFLVPLTNLFTQTMNISSDGPDDAAS
ncbi:Na+/H+ antiporter NhaC family protein [Sporomusa sp. GT1]|uniref:Na+/H+ antiporter NhaC family protein n=1 Tax=Sporomusa sp. GT1 TaxID=1534747 RepID=UPI00166AFAF5|nr:Na+/H+ antiporter NhaC family protein [Sporomusa sp. GT1]